MVDAQKVAELRHVISETPGEFSYGPATFAGCVPDVTCNRPDGTLIVLRADEYAPRGIAVKYARRLAACANEMPGLLDENEALKRENERLSGLLETAQVVAGILEAGENHASFFFSREDRETVHAFITALKE